MAFARYQRGLSFYGWLTVMGLIVFFGLLTIKLAPVYLDNYKVNQAILKLGKDPESGELTEGAIRTSIAKQFDIEMINDVKPEDITITEEEGIITVEVQYEVRVPLFYNVDAVVSFHDTSEIKQKK